MAKRGVGGWSGAFLFRSLPFMDRKLGPVNSINQPLKFLFEKIKKSQKT